MEVVPADRAADLVTRHGPGSNRIAAGPVGSGEPGFRDARFSCTERSIAPTLRAHASKAQEHLAESPSRPRETVMSESRVAPAHTGVVSDEAFKIETHG